MKESLSSRVGRIISGGAHMLVEAVENMAPEAVMEEAVREIDGAMDEVRTEIGKNAANKHLASKRLMEENRKHEDLAAKIELALSEGREDLAEAAIAQQLDIEAQIPVLEGTVATCVEQATELEGYLDALKAKKREMVHELAEFRRSREATGDGAAAGGSTPQATKLRVEGSVERAESAFDRVLERATGAGSSSGQHGAETAAQLAELEDLSRKNRIQERLAAAKAKAAAPDVDDSQ